MRHIVGVVAVLMGIAAAGSAVAAPQILGLTASRAPIPFTCSGDACTAIAGTFCLQHERAVPRSGVLYEASHPEQITLALLTGDGRTIRIAGGDTITFSAYSGYTMVRMDLPRSLLAAHDATALTAEIGPGVSLMPRAEVGDGYPQSPDEIALATGPMRLAAAHYLDQPSVGIDAARLVTALVNALPEQRAIRDDNRTLWSSTITASLADGLDPAAVAGARGAYERCSDQADLRRCLISRHRELMANGNAAFWDETAGY